MRKRSPRNPAELLIFGNPGGRRHLGPRGHKAGCKCFACKRLPRGANRAKNAFEQSIRSGSREAFIYGDSGRGPFTIRFYEGGRSAAAGSQSAKSLREARSIARRFASKKNPRRQKKARTGRAVKNARPHRNPSETEQAVRLFETFHGKQAGSIVEKHVSAAMRKDYTALGNLLYVKVKTPVGQTAKFEFEHDGVMLASSPDGKQLYCIGGNQNLLPLLDDDSKQKDFLDLGECQEVAYLARKIHSNYEPIEWFHKFGEARDGSTKPQLMFDRLKKQLFFVGGEYWIDPDVDISPGIEN